MRMTEAPDTDSARVRISRGGPPAISPVTGKPSIRAASKDQFPSSVAPLPAELVGSACSAGQKNFLTSLPVKAKRSKSSGISTPPNRNHLFVSRVRRRRKAPYPLSFRLGMDSLENI